MILTHNNSIEVSVIFFLLIGIMLQSEEQLQSQNQQLTQTINLFLSAFTIDHHLLSALPHVPDPSHLFAQIIGTKIPHRKDIQLHTVTLLAACFYRLNFQGHDNLQTIALCYEQYLSIAQYVPIVIQFYEKIRKWSKQLKKTRNLMAGKRGLMKLLKEIQESGQQKLVVVQWRVSLSLLALEGLFKKKAVERQTVVAIMRKYGFLKEQKLIDYESISQLFLMVLQSLIEDQNQCYSFFQLELQKIVANPLLSASLRQQIQQQLQKCQQKTTDILFKGSVRVAAQEISNRKTTILSMSRKQKINIRENGQFELVNRIVRGSHKSRQSPKQDKLFRKVDMLMRTRQTIHTRSQERQKTTCKITFNSIEKPTLSLHSTTRIGWYNKEKDCQVNQSSQRLSATTNGCKSTGFGKRTIARKRREVYKHIKEKQSKDKVISTTNLLDQMKELPIMEIQRCKITFAQILLGEGKNHRERDDANVKFTGAAEDNDFDNLKLSYLTIFNQQMACLQLVIKQRGKLGYHISCKINSTYCSHAANLLFQKAENYHQQLGVQDIKIYLQSSFIFYEALQERVERRVGMMQLQAMEELFRQRGNLQLSQQQITKILRAVDLVESQFFWYYTKSSCINGSRLQKRRQINFDDLSAFAVSLGKFKSDYDNCLSEIVQVQNMRSLIETCIYLSHGRLVVHKAFRNIRSRLYLQVISINEQVYPSFRRVGKKPSFGITYLQRTLINLDRNRVVKRQKGNRIDLTQILAEDDVFIFFMKNVVENFIEIKYLRAIEAHLLEINRKENQQYEEERKVVPTPHFSQEVVTNSEEIEQSVEFRPALHHSLRSLKNTILMYCQAYHLVPQLHLISTMRHSLKINDKIHQATEIRLQNGLRIVKLYKSLSSTYSLFLYHQPPAELVQIITPFHNRLALHTNEAFHSNLVRRDQKQPFISAEYSNIVKIVLKLAKGYCYSSISECQKLLIWRVDLYCPTLQIHAATYIDESTFLELVSDYGGEEDLWKKCLAETQPNQDWSSLKMGKKQLKLFSSHKQMNLGKERLMGNIELVEIDGNLSYLITNFNLGTLSLGAVEQMPFIHSKHIFSSVPSSKLKVTTYNYLIVQLYKKLTTGRLPSESIATDYFQLFPND